MDIGRIAQRFPLVARPRPACPLLVDRVREISTLAEAASNDGGLSSGAAAMNRAALIASDCGLPDLARELCWRHAETYLCAQPLSAQEARYALEPLVNLARLRIRDEDGEGAYQLLADLHHAVRHEAEATIEDRSLSFRNLTSTPDDHRAVCQWLWAVLLGDGTRALVAAHRWPHAREHAVHHKGIGRRLLDGRQVDIVSRCLSGDATSALRVLDESKLAEAWETPVAACLSVLCRTASGRPIRDAAVKMATDYLDLDVAPELVVFRARLGLTVLGLSTTNRAEVARRLVNEATRSQDGYVARDVLANAVCAREMTACERRQLADAVTAAGLDQGSIPPDLQQSLLDAVEVSASAVEKHLAVRQTS